MRNNKMTFIKINKMIYILIGIISVSFCSNDEKYFDINLNNKKILIYEIKETINDSVETRIVFLKRIQQKKLIKSNNLKPFFSEISDSSEKIIESFMELNYSDWFGNLVKVDDGIIRYSDYERKKKRYLIKYPIKLNDSWENNIPGINLIDLYKITSIDTTIIINEKKYKCIETKIKRKYICDQSGDISYENIILYINKNYGLVYWYYWHYLFENVEIEVKLLDMKEN